jgi:hypothetical protein
MEKCFVIQPFDKDKFDRRFKDVFQPAITNANLEPYRIDLDLSVRIPIDEIEKGIKDSSICFAEITTDNPNVWYELGFAFACEKDVILVCSDERESSFPFDIQHRQIITYKTSSKSDFEVLEDTITKKIIALRSTSKKVKILSDTPVIEKEGLKSHEIAILILLMENQFSIDDSYSVSSLKSEMSKSGYTDIATSVGIKALVEKDMVMTFKKIDDYNNYEYYACRLTDTGIGWIMSNQNQFQFRKTKPENPGSLDDDLPF